MTVTRSEYVYESAIPSHTNAYLWPKVESILQQYKTSASPTVAPRIFDLGCGNGSFLRRLRKIGFSGQGVDPSSSGIRQAKTESPDLNVEEGSAYDDLAAKYGQFPIVVSLEVVEHLYSPRLFAKTLFELTEPGGVAIVSTPYHGYVKNIVMAVSGKLDSHFTALWDHGHIKFWSIRTLTILLEEAGFTNVRFEFAGRISLLAKSMIAIATRPGENK